MFTTSSSLPALQMKISQQAVSLTCPPGHRGQQPGSSVPSFHCSSEPDYAAQSWSSPISQSFSFIVDFFPGVSLSKIRGSTSMAPAFLGYIHP